MTMKTILIPTERGESMSSALQTALLLARRFDSYIEGFALQPGISQFLAVDMGGSVATESFRQESIEEAKKAKATFESFMQERGVPRSSQAAASPSGERSSMRPSSQRRWSNVAGLTPVLRNASAIPSRCRMRDALGPILMPAPTSLSAFDCSKTCTSNPARSSNAAAVRPPMPPPMIAIEVRRATVMLRNRAC